MGPEDFAGRPLARVMEEVAGIAVRVVDGVAQTTVRPLRDISETLDLGARRTVAADGDGAAFVDTPTLQFGRMGEGHDAEGVEYWEPGAQDWSEHSTRRFDMLEMGDGYIGEDVPGRVSASGVYYCRNDFDRQPFRLHVRDDNLIYDANGRLFDTREGKLIDVLGRRQRRAIFVMDADGNFYASLFGKRHVFQHSSFFAGEPVAGAGVIEVVNGELRMLSDDSGHYLPERRHMLQVVDRLRELGVRVDPDRVLIRDGGA
ncbi:hypothetical protein AB0B25_20905 [Nocardia sp. NPDC049190]|uniref:hypothetical protein n=1 Tax=Nocardia sp. NPDC049190 TaxID=3155650 RepID=UPI0033DEA28D